MQKCEQKAHGDCFFEQQRLPQQFTRYTSQGHIFITYEKHTVMLEG